MTSLVTTSIKDPLERIPLTFDFTRKLGKTDSISVFALAVEAVVAGTDASPNNILDGVPMQYGKKGTHWIIGGVAGATYRLRATVTTAEGRTRVLRCLLPVATLT